LGALHSRLLTPYPVTSSGKAAPGPDQGIRHRTQIGMFRPIRFDHTNCLQVAIKSIQFTQRRMSSSCLRFFAFAHPFSCKQSLRLIAVYLQMYTLGRIDIRLNISIHFFPTSCAWRKTWEVQTDCHQCANPL